MKDFNVLYAKYKSYLLPVIFIALSLFIILKIIIPQLSSTGTLRSEIVDKRDEVTGINNSLSALSNQNEDELTDNLELAIRALPTSKNIAIIFDALSSAAAESDTDLREFTLKVGGLYGKAEGPVVGINTPSIKVEIRVGGADAKNIVNFTSEVRKRLPLSDTIMINNAGSFATIEMIFFYKPLNLAAIAAQNRVLPLSQTDKNLLKQLSEWDSREPTSEN